MSRVGMTIVARPSRARMREPGECGGHVGARAGQ
jgi:hypothetical protein